MSTQLVSIERAKTAPQVRLWDGRLAVAGTPLKVTIAQAADLMTREPDEWTLAAKADADLVKAELKTRAGADKPATPGGGN